MDVVVQHTLADRSQPMLVRIHPTHRFYTQLEVGLLALPAVMAGFAAVLGLAGADLVLLAFGISAALLLAWILWRNTSCRCPQCGARLRVDRESGRPPGGAQQFRCQACEILWDDRMQRGAG